LRLGSVVVAAQNNRVETIVGPATRILEAIEAVRSGGIIEVAG
jgi:hypothetical protein